MARMSSSNKCVYVDILDDDGCVIGVAHAFGCANNDKFVKLLKDINEFAFTDFGTCFFQL